MGIAYESQLDELRAVVRGVCPHTTIQADGLSAIAFLQLDVGETLPQEFVSAVQEICDSYDERLSALWLTVEDTLT